MADFQKALDEVKPAFGANTEGLEVYRMAGMIPYGDAFSHLQATLHALVNQVGGEGGKPGREGGRGGGKGAVMGLRGWGGPGRG